MKQTLRMRMERQRQRGHYRAPPHKNHSGLAAVSLAGYISALDPDLTPRCILDALGVAPPGLGAYSLSDPAKPAPADDELEILGLFGRLDDVRFRFVDDPAAPAAKAAAAWAAAEIADGSFAYG